MNMMISQLKVLKTKPANQDKLYFSYHMWACPYVCTFSEALSNALS